MFEMFFISAVFFKSSRINLIVRKGKIICYVMRDLPQVHVIHPLPFWKTVLFSMDQCIYILPEFWKCTGNLVPFIDKRWLTIRQDASNIKRQPVFFQPFVLCVCYNITCQWNMWLLSHVFRPSFLKWLLCCNNFPVLIIYPELQKNKRNFGKYHWKFLKKQPATSRSSVSYK